jgi:hypothetical protein
MGLARPIPADLRNRVGDIGDPPIIECVAVRRGKFGGSREILRGDERERQPRHKAQESNDGVAAFRAYPAPQGGRRPVASELNRLIGWQGNRLRPKVRDVCERLPVDLLADRTVAEKAADGVAGDSEARRATEAGAILVHRRHTVARRRSKPRSRSSFRSSMSSSPTLKRIVGPPGAKRVAVRVPVQSKGTARLS